MTPHTPGPWTADNFGMKVFTSGDPYGHGAMNVADVRGWGHLTGGGACKFNEVKAAGIQSANARLIAAAPELLSALKALVCQDGACDGEACKAGHVAIAKAEGRS